LVRIETRSLIVRYGATFAVAGVSLAVDPGTVLAVVGPNGSGKSSLVRAIAGLCPADGEILFDGSPTRPAQIGYMPQDIGTVAALTVLEVVLLGRLGKLGLRVGPADFAAVQSVLDELGIGALAPRYLAELSGGQRQLAFLAQALACQPPILLLDEPISALDIRHQLQVLEIVRDLTRARGLATVIVVHDLNAAIRFADDLALLHQGRLVAHGAPDRVLTAQTLKDVFAVDAAVQRGPDARPIVIPLRSIPQEASA
jgi:iron complex transport system ATP-binding protein